MSAVSNVALRIVEQMEPQRAYEMRELWALAPELNRDALRETIRDLWIAREVERCGDYGWRLAQSHCGAAASVEVDPARLRIGLKPQDLFNHSAFEGVFK